MSWRANAVTDERLRFLNRAGSQSRVGLRSSLTARRVGRTMILIRGKCPE
jgi:hypothetical protein